MLAALGGLVHLSFAICIVVQVLMHVCERRTVRASERARMCMHLNVVEFYCLQIFDIGLCIRLRVCCFSLVC